MKPFRGPTRRIWYAVRGLAAVLVAAVVAAALVARASGNLERTASVYVGVPVSAGLISGQAPVRYHGVNIGRIAEIESGTEVSQVRLAIDREYLSAVPASVVARIVPRTFFGDIYLQLLDRPGVSPAGALSADAQIEMDTSGDAMALYDVFTKILAVFSQIEPERMQEALTAISQALRGRGTDIASTIDSLSASMPALEPALGRFLDATPRFREVMQSLQAATPDIVTTLEAATRVSNRMLENRDGIDRAATVFAGFAQVLTAFLSDHRENMITVLDATGNILATTGALPEGLTQTLSNAQAFGEAGGRVFASGNFSITAVATFAGPMPYTVDYCPTYRNLTGAHCALSSGDAEPAMASVPVVPPVGVPPLPAEMPPPAEVLPPVESAPLPPVEPLPNVDPSVTPGAAPAAWSTVVGTEQEFHALGVLQNELLPDSATESAAGEVHPATVLMLGPLVRGTEVRVS